MEVYKHKLFTSGTLTCFSAQESSFCKEHFTLRRQVGSQKSKGIIYRKVKGKHYNMSPLRGFEPQAVSPNKVIPAGWRISCAPLSACLYSRPEERRSEDYPRWTVWNDNFWSTFTRIETSDLPILLSDTLPADIFQNRAPNTKEAVPTTIRFKPQIYRCCCLIIYLPTFTNLVQLLFLSHTKNSSIVCFLSVPFFRCSYCQPFCGPNNWVLPIMRAALLFR